MIYAIYSLDCFFAFMWDNQYLRNGSDGNYADAKESPSIDIFDYVLKLK